jgi:N-acetylmuramoyl-L-alanine amidase
MISVAASSFVAGFFRASCGSGLPSVLGILASLAMTLGGPAPASAQTGDALLVHGPDDSSLSLSVSRSRGYATVPHEALRRLGWAIEVDASRLRARLGSDGPLVEFSLDSPFFYWDEDLLQLVSAPFSRDGSVQIPLQFVVDFLPARASEAYAFSPGDGALHVLDPSLWLEARADGSPLETAGGRIANVDTSGDGSFRDDPSRDEPVSTDTSSVPALQQDLEEAQDPEKRVVVIDPGHGGGDPGTTGEGGRREKDIALAIGRYLERELRGDENFEVYLTRDRDVLVPLWERGPQATLLKGDRAGVFISIHVNSSPASPAIRGFETYFLSEARTEHERRVAAIENAPIQLEAELDGGDVEDIDLTFIGRELQTLDHQHWSSLLAEGIQYELEGVHPGPNRGVKQGPFAVITNALMPAVLVEVGFISNREEERVLSRAEFQRGVAAALAQGIRDFFERYPPGQGVALQSPPR